MSIIQQRGLTIYKKLDTDIQDIIDYYIQLKNKRIINWLNFEIKQLYRQTYESHFPYFEEYPQQTYYLKYSEYYEKMKDEEGYINSIVYNTDNFGWRDFSIPMEFFFDYINNAFKSYYSDEWNMFRGCAEDNIIVDTIDKWGENMNLRCYKIEKLFVELKEVLDKKNKNKIQSIFQSILCEYDTEIQNLIIQKEAIQNRTNMIWELQQYITISQEEICDREGKLITIEEWNIEYEYFNYPEYYVKGENREFYNNYKYFSNLMLDIINNTFGLVK